MKPTLFIVLLLTIATHFLHAQTNQKMILDSVITQRHYLSEDKWIKAYKEEFEYDEKNDLKLFLGSAMDTTSDQWIIMEKNLYDYDDDHYLESEETYLADSTNKLVPDSKYTYVIDDNKKQIEIIGYDKSEDGTEFQKSYKRESVYENGNEIMTSTYRWDTLYHQWQIYDKDVNSFLGNGLLASTKDFNFQTDGDSMEISSEMVYYYSTEKLDSILVYEVDAETNLKTLKEKQENTDLEDGSSINIYYFIDTTGQNWIPQRRTTRLVNENDALTGKLDQIWSEETNSWINDTQSEYNILEGGYIIEREMKWDTTDQQWVGESDIELDLSSELIQKKTFTWNSSEKEWQDSTLIEIYKDTENDSVTLVQPIWFSNSMIVLYTKQMNWSDIRNDYVDYESKTYYYSDLINTSVHDRNTFKINVFPVPAESFLTVQHNVVDQIPMVDIVTTDGNMIYKNECISGTKIDLSSIPAGIYFLTISTRQSRIFSKKIIVL